MSTQRHRDRGAADPREDALHSPAGAHADPSEDQPGTADAASACLSVCLAYCFCRAAQVRCAHDWHGGDDAQHPEGRVGGAAHAARAGRWAGQGAAGAGGDQDEVGRDI